jgi:hypothetical protein
MFEELDCVRLLVDKPEEGLTKGRIGTIVIVYTVDGPFEVEFIEDEWGRGTLVTLQREEVAELSQQEASTAKVS